MLAPEKVEQTQASDFDFLNIPGEKKYNTIIYSHWLTYINIYKI